MSISIHRESVVGADGKIELTVPELAPGQRVTVTIELPATQHYTDPLVAAMLAAGHLASLPSLVPDSPEEAAERERLAEPAAPGPLASDLVIQDRGPR